MLGRIQLDTTLGGTGTGNCIGCSGGFGGFKCDTGHGFGYWLALLCSLGAAALAFMRKDATD